MNSQIPVCSNCILDLQQVPLHIQGRLRISVVYSLIFRNRQQDKQSQNFIQQLPDRTNLCFIDPIYYAN